MDTVPSRRKFLKITGMAIATVSWAAAGPVAAGTNAPLREQFKYQDKPDDGRSCASCLEFIPGKTDKTPGACKRIPGDDEISPDGYCVLWNTM